MSFGDGVNQIGRKTEMKGSNGGGLRPKGHCRMPKLCGIPQQASRYVVEDTVNVVAGWESWFALQLRANAGIEAWRES